MLYAAISNGSASLLKLHEIGYSADRSITRFGPGQTNYFIVHYVLNGKGFFNGNPVRAGQGFLIYGGQTIAYGSDENDPWEFLWAIVEDAAVRPLFDRYHADPQTQIFSYDPEGLSVLNRTVGQLVAGGTRIVDSLAVLEAFLHILNATMPAASRMESVSNAEVYLDYAEKYVEDHIDRPVTVQELTRLLGVSQPYLYRIFQKNYRTSPKQYILSRKLHHAKRLLAETDLSITEIAHSVGYADVLTFSRLFARKETRSPQQYRAALASKRPPAGSEES